MIKNVITQLCIIFCLICFFACEKQKEELPDIRIGIVPLVAVWRGSICRK